MRRKMIMAPAVAAAAALALGATTYAAATPSETADSSGQQSAQVSDALELRVMSYNIRHGYDYDADWGDINDPDTGDAPHLHSTLEAIQDADPDVVAIQEISEHFALGHFRDQVEWLAERLDMESWLGDNRPDDEDVAAGNAVLSKHPIVDESNELLVGDSDVEGAQRGLMRTTLNVDGTALDVYNTHLAHRTTPEARALRVAQTEQVIDTVGTPQDNPMLLAADLNAPPAHDPDAGLPPTPAELLVEHGFGDAWTQVDTDDEGNTIPVDPDAAADRRVDYVMTSPHFDVVSGDVPQTLASDHYPVVVDVRWDPSTLPN